MTNKTYFITGAEGVGKTSITKYLKEKFPKMHIHDFDEVGVPKNPPLKWRLDTTLFWIKESIKNQRKGYSTCIIGLSFPSEAMSFKEIKKLENVNFFLLDVNERERAIRLSKRNASQEVIEDLDQLISLRKEFVDHSKNIIDTSDFSIKEVLSIIMKSISH